MTGAQLREALEHAASFFESWPFPAGEPVRLPSFSVDSAEGVNYTIDLRHPPGYRIVELRYKGKPLAGTQKLRVAVNNYRYAGGDNYTVFKGLPIVYRSTEEIRDLIIEHLARTRVVPTTTDHNWRIEPLEAVEALRRAALEQEIRVTPSAQTSTHSSIFSTLDVTRSASNCEVLAKPRHNFAAAGGN
jgi:2',3'-cyclic-nucleotide 2'-phosphodiesterase/3'-nucleotidase